ncbi:hypothetical protein L7F22_006696 [Adiantum nelumboides]|nr:hypothetical protein [Adiantum nelumboides]
MPQRNVSKLVQSLCARVGLISGNFTNKSLRMTAVSRMSLAEVPVEVGMQVTVHRRVDNYEKSDATSSLKLAAAQSILSSPLDADGNPKKFSDVYEQHVSKFCALSRSTSKGDAYCIQNLPQQTMKQAGLDAFIMNVDGSNGNITNVGGLTGPHDAEIEDDTQKLIGKEWPEGAKTVSLGSRSSFNSMFNGAVFNNCVINVHGLAGSSHGYGRARK